MLELEEFQRINSAENYVITAHSRRRMAERGIGLRDVIHAVEQGEIIEQYPEDRPFPSCLILGSSVDMRALHAVVSLDEGYIYLITAYFPAEADWNPGFKTRRT